MWRATLGSAAARQDNGARNEGLLPRASKKARVATRMKTMAMRIPRSSTPPPSHPRRRRASSLPDVPPRPSRRMPSRFPIHYFLIPAHAPPVILSLQLYKAVAACEVGATLVACALPLCLPFWPLPLLFWSLLWTPSFVSSGPFSYSEARHGTLSSSSIITIDPKCLHHFLNLPPFFSTHSSAA